MPHRLVVKALMVDAVGYTVVGSGVGPVVDVAVVDDVAVGSGVDLVVVVFVAVVAPGTAGGIDPSAGIADGDIAADGVAAVVGDCATAVVDAAVAVSIAVVAVVVDDDQQ